MILVKTVTTKNYNQINPIWTIFLHNNLIHLVEQ